MIFKHVKISLIGIFCILFVALLCAPELVFAQKVVNEADTFPQPPIDKNRMFYIQRTPNINTIIYELNYLKSGELNSEKPIHEYWIRYGEKGHPKKELNFIQRKFAYGVKTQLIKRDQWEIRLVSYDKVPLILQKGKDGKYHVFVQIHKKLCIFEKAYIKIDGGTFWSPNVLYIEMFGRDPETMERTSYKIYP